MIFTGPAGVRGFECPWCYARLWLLPVRHCRGQVLELAHDSWEHLADHHSIQR